VLGLLPQDSGRDEGVDGVDGRRVDAHHQLTVAGTRLQDVANGGVCVEAVEEERARRWALSSRCGVPASSPG